MARPLRIEYAGAWYHVMNRVAGRGLVFKERWTTDLFLRMLQEADHRFQVEGGIGSGLVLTHFWSRLMTWLVPFVSNSQVPSIM